MSIGTGDGRRRSGVRCGVRICGFNEERSIAEGDGRVRRHEFGVWREESGGMERGGVGRESTGE